MTTAMINDSKVIQPKPALKYDDDTDKKLSAVFINLLEKIRQRQKTLNILKEYIV